MVAMSLSERRVLITGAAGGVGRAITLQLLEAGARLMVTDRDKAMLERMIEELGGPQRMTLHAGDLSRREDIDELFARVDDALGGLDILVACTGVGAEPLMAFGDQSWRDVIESNLVSHVACTQAAVGRIRRAPRGTGSVILLGSISVHIKAVGESVYNAAKGGVASFAETLRKELIPDEIRVTLIEPGAIGSAMQPFDPEERARRVAAFQLLPPDEVADAILFAATRPPGVDCVTLRIEPMDQKIW
jgi:3-hydroxy acid dehydrogenase / malonic semialdehyde reductase